MTPDQEKDTIAMLEEWKSKKLAIERIEKEWDRVGWLWGLLNGLAKTIIAIGAVGTVIFQIYKNLRGGGS